MVGWEQANVGGWLLASPASLGAGGIWPLQWSNCGKS